MRALIVILLTFVIAFEYAQGVPLAQLQKSAGRGHKHRSGGNNHHQGDGASNQHHHRDGGSDNRQEGGESSKQDYTGNVGSGGFDSQQGGDTIDSLPSGGGFDSNTRPNRQTSKPNRRTTTSTTTSTPATTNSTSTTSSADTQMNDCISKCPTTNQYDPVCGDDATTYSNEGKLRCAQRCKKQVQVSYRGRCVATAAPDSRR